MSVNKRHLKDVLVILTDREKNRLEHSMNWIHSTPAHAFYSVANSMKHQNSNRYSNILAYDRTAVALEGGGYLNANVVCDARGGWWVASQVSSQIA